MLSWDPNTEPDLAGYKVYYRASSGTYGTPTNVGNQTTHTVSGLLPGTYYFAVTAFDTSGNESGFSNEVFKTITETADTTPPSISAISNINTTSNGATITWTTDEPATTQMEYGLTTAYGNVTTLNPTLLVNHTEALSGLLPTTVYHYQVRSTDTAGNTSSSADLTFTTTAISSPDTTPPADIQNFTATAGNQQLTLTWKNSHDPDFVGVRIRYRTDQFPIDINDGILLGDISGQPNELMSTLHTGLENGVTYYYSASSYDSNGNFQSTAFMSATPTVPSNGSVAEQTFSGGGCGMIIPTDGNPPAPGQAADMTAIAGIIVLILMKKRFEALRQPCLHPPIVERT